MQNPVLLADHDRNKILGKFTVVREDDTGLYVEALMSNSSAQWLRDVRFKIAEGHLRALSMGGRFYYDLADEHRITKVDLCEGSLYPVPSNPDAIFTAA
jgi:HK97 family phage prohead protease